MWNFTMLDTSSTINRRACSHADVIPKASSIATKILCPVIRFRPLFPPASSSHLPLLPTHLFFPPASSSHLRTQRTYIPAAPHLRPRRTPDTPPGSPQALPRHTPRHSPDTPPGTPQTFPQALLGHSPGTSPGSPQPHPQAHPRHTPPSPKSHVIPPGPHSQTA